MTSHLLPWLIAGPVLATLVVPALGAIYPTGRSSLYTLAHVGTLVLVALALAAGPTSSVVEVRSGPLGIQLGLTLDRATGGALILTALLLLAVSWFSQTYVRGARHGTVFLSLLLLEQAAVNLTLLAGDLLALYAGLLALSFALMLMIGVDFGSAGGAAALRVFATLEVPAALAFVGFWMIDARAGTLSLSDLPHDANWLSAPTSWALLLPIVVALVSRAGLTPLQNWVVAGCRAAAAPAAAAIAGVALPVGALVLSRLAGVAIPLDSSWLHGLLLLAGATAIVGGIGALRERTALGWLGYLAIGQVGLASLGFLVDTPVGPLDGWIALASSAVAITLVAMAIGLAIRTARHDRIDAPVHLPRNSVAWWSFLVGLASLAPLPPFTTFSARRLLLASLLNDGSAWSMLAAMAVVAGTILLTTAIGRVFLELVHDRWSDQTPSTIDGTPHRRERVAGAWPPGGARPKRSIPDGRAALAILAAVLVAFALIPLTWLTSPLGVTPPLPTPGASLPSTVLLLFAIVVAPCLGYLALGRSQPEHSSYLLARIGRRVRLDVALDPYVLIGGALLALGRLSAATLDQTLGRLARAR